MRFGGRLAGRVAERESQLVLGLDPDPARLWPAALARAPTTGAPAERAAAAVGAHCAALIDAAGELCVAVKLQLACFERLGAPGWAALARVVEHARAAGLLVIADAKRGDVPVSAAAYAQALVGSTATPFGEVPGLGVDAFTANPLLGRDALAPLVDAARETGGGLFVLVRTSNPGAADVEDVATVASGAEGARAEEHGPDALTAARPLWERLAELVVELGGEPDGAGLSDVGAVVGATEPEHLARMRELMPHAVFLLPGIGAQGGQVEHLAPAFSAGPAGGLVTASRAIAEAARPGDDRPQRAAREVAARLREAAWGLAADAG